MQQYTAANLSLAWDCTITPTANPAVWLAWRGDRPQPVAAVWVDETALEFERAEDNCQAVLGHRAGPGMIVVMPISASETWWSAGQGRKTLAMPVTPRRQPREPRWWCETCKGTHPIGTGLMKACREGRLRA